jgi:hypothetical protein
VNFAALDIGNDLIQKSRQHANEPRFGLAAQAQQDEIMTGKNGVDDLRYDSIFVAENAGKQSLPALYFTNQVFSEFVFDGAVPEL